MGKAESLITIEECWRSPDMSLFDKSTRIAAEYYSSNLRLNATAAYIGATPSELDALLALSELDEEMLQLISEANPPITTWMMLASASDEEVVAAIREMEGGRNRRDPHDARSVEQRLFSVMIEVSGPTQDQVLSTLPYNVLMDMYNRAQAFKALTDRNTNAIKSMGNYRRRGKPLTPKQVKYLKSLLTDLVNANAITRNGIDDDQESCDIVLDALEM